MSLIHWAAIATALAPAGNRAVGRRLSMESLEPRLALSRTVLIENFDDDAVNSQPNSADFLLNADGPEAFIQVAGPGGAYQPPFGPSGNHALVIDNPGTAQPIISWTDAFSDDPADFQTGTISFDLYLPEPSPEDYWTYIDIRLGYGGADRVAPTTVGDTTIWNSFRVNQVSADVVMDNGNGSAQAAIGSARELHVVYDIDGASRTYRLTINGTPITFGTGNANRPWRAGSPGINMLAFVGAYPVTSSPVTIDNLVVVQPGVGEADEPTEMLEWHQHRGNKRLTGEANVSDDIVTDAQILWSQFIASRESWIGVKPGNGSSVAEPPTDDVAMTLEQRMSWGLGGPYFDLGQTGALTPVTTHSLLRIGDFIPGNGALEKLEGEVFDTTFGQGVIRLSVYQNGAWVQQWQSPQIPVMHGTANIITGDFDNDGQLEVAITPWTTMYILDMATGQVERTGAFKPPSNESGRPYGWFGAHDLTGDGREEFILMGDFQDFIAVMGWNAAGELVKLWEHVFDPRLSNKQTSHRPMAFPVRDVTGDGKLDIATTVYNESGDGKWHVRIFNALTGAPLHDLVDHAIDGARDVDGDGDFELFARQTEGALLSSTATGKILDWNGAGFDTLWSQANSAFVDHDISDFPAHTNSVTSTRGLDLLTGPIVSGGDEVFFTRRLLDAATRIMQVDVWQFDGAGAVANLGSASGPELDVRAVRAAGGDDASILLSTEVVGASPKLAGDFDGDNDVDGADFLAWQRSLGQSGSNLPADPAPNGTIDGNDLIVLKQQFGDVAAHVLKLNDLGGATAAFSQLSSPPRSSAVVGKLEGPESQPTVVVQGGSNTIVALRPQVGGQVEVTWTSPGLGGYTGASQFQGQHGNSGVALGDVNGDGSLETLYASQGATGRARLVAASPSGAELWHAEFDVPGGPRLFNQPGLVLWRTGHFTSPEYEDVLVQIMRGIGGTGEFHLLDGRTGDTLWTRDYGNNPGTFSTQRGAGETHLAVYDWDHDGLDEAVNFNPDMFYVVDGNGVNLVQKSVNGGGVFPGGSPLYGAPVVADFRNNGTDSILFAGSYAQLGLVDRNGVKVWSTPFIFDNTPGFIQGVGDVDGDGDLDVLSAGHPVAPATYTAARFHAYDGATGALLWQVDLPGHPFGPVGGALADTPTLSVSGDIDGDGRVESLFAIGDTLYAVGAAPDGASGQIEWTFRPDGGLLGSPIIVDANGDGWVEIVVVSASGFVYGIGNADAASAAAHSAAEAPAMASDADDAQVFALAPAGAAQFSNDPASAISAINVAGPSSPKDAIHRDAEATSTSDRRDIERRRLHADAGFQENEVRWRESLAARAAIGGSEPDDDISDGDDIWSLVDDWRADLRLGAAAR